jgi:hypothetical protein
MRSDPIAPVPFYARLSFFDTTERGFDRLIALIAGNEIEPASLLRLLREGERRVLLLLDGFNEVATQFQTTCATAIRELLQMPRHGVLVTSRPDMAFDSVGGQESGIKTATVVELRDDDVKTFLGKEGVGELYEQLSEPLRQLVKNPFMLWALSQSCADLPRGELPRNQGALYRNFVDRYIFELREQRKSPPPTRYNYTLVKRPVLSQLALQMAREGTTRRQEDLSILKEIATQLNQIKAE